MPAKRALIIITMRIGNITFIRTCAAVVALSLLFVFGACDKIEGPYITHDDSVDTDVEFPPLDTQSVFSKILIEEYTGQMCVNCPNGHRELENLARFYHDTLIAIGIHAGVFAIPTPTFSNDFRTEEGTTLYSDFQVATVGTPSAVINRKQFNGAFPLNVAQWRQSIAECTGAAPRAAIQIINQYDASAQLLTVNTKTTIIDDYQGTLQLILYVIEDHIVGPQKDGEETVMDYEHQHVLRGSVNGTYGARLTTDGIVEKGQGYTKSYQLSCSGNNWNIDNCSIVAILADADTKEVVQVEKCSFR